MIDVKTALIERIQLFTDVFQKTLLENKYEETSLVIDRIENFNLKFPSSPEIKCSWKSVTNQRMFSYRITLDYFSDFEFENLITNETISINSFKKNRDIQKIEIYSMSGEEIDENLRRYIKSSLILIETSDLFSVLNGSNWINLPFDWQGHK